MTASSGTIRPSIKLSSRQGELHYDLTEPLHGVVAWALPGGVGVFLLASAALLFRTTSHRSPLLLAGGAVCLVAGPAVTFVPSLVALALLAALVTALVLGSSNGVHISAPQ
ncbi:hypothetical protein ABZ835_44165 [Streptomyces sp. NPDC047461]|uniref:hypothetical protein n=1 Tax=Streptomyces sp. NPDC047461 TaxID=3155619 RepID=UPI0033E02910